MELEIQRNLPTYFSFSAKLYVEHDLLVYIRRTLWPRGLGIANELEGSAQTPLAVQIPLETQPRYKAPSDLPVKTWINAIINMAWVRL